MSDLPDEAARTAVMDALPHAVHPMHDNWRANADALIWGLRQRGWVIVRDQTERQLRRTVADGIARLIDGYPNGNVDVINALLDAEIIALGGGSDA